jgi:predicted DNA-binding transcriptional regulator AlpA
MADLPGRWTVDQDPWLGAVARNTDESSRKAPHSLEAEQALLGAILVNNEALDRVGDHEQMRAQAGSKPELVRSELNSAGVLMTPRQAANYTGLAIATLQRQRTEGTCPKFVKIGKRRVGYRLADLLSWLDARVANSTADARVRGLAR